MSIKRRTRPAVPLFIPPELQPCRDCGQAERMPGWRLCRVCWGIRHGRSKPGSAR